MRIAIRTDASVEIGTGHVMRCLTLANALREHSVECTFICRPHAGHLMGLISQSGHDVVALASPEGNKALTFEEHIHCSWLGNEWEIDALQTKQALGFGPVDCLVVDHYGVDYRWERVLKKTCHRLVVIDDLANRRHECDLLVDPNLGRIPGDYKLLVNPEADLLVGPEYALLRPEFSELRRESLSRRKSPQLKRILVSMGGVDKDNLTAGVLTALAECALAQELQITVVLGASSPWLNEVKKLALEMPQRTEVHCDVKNMGYLMLQSDLAIGAAGGTSWERCCLALPTFLLIQADNQRQGALALERAGAATVLENVDEITTRLDELLVKGGAGQLAQMSRRSASITDGLGATKVVKELVLSHA